MSLLIEGRIAQFIFLVIICAISLLMVELAKRREIKIRRLPAMDSLREGVGRATEMGRPLHFTTGSGRTGLMHQDAAPQILAGLSVLGHIAVLCGELGARIINTISNPDVLPVSTEIIREGYRTAGHPESFNEDDIRFISSDHFSYAAGVMATIEREQVATNIMIGGFWAESLMFAETGARLKAIQIAGTAKYNQLPFFIAVCDYVLLGEEIYAAGAYLSKDPLEVGGVVGQDVVKVLVIIMILIGSLLATGGNFWLKTILGM